jgi:hypothetical protein
MLHNKIVISVLAATGANVTIPFAVPLRAKIKSVIAIAEGALTAITCELRTSTNTVFSGSVEAASTPVTFAKNATYGDTIFDPDSATAALTYINLYVPQASAAKVINFTIEFDPQATVTS